MSENPNPTNKIHDSERYILCNFLHFDLHFFKHDAGTHTGLWLLCPRRTRKLPQLCDER